MVTSSSHSNYYGIKGGSQSNENKEQNSPLRKEDGVDGCVKQAQDFDPANHAALYLDKLKLSWNM